MREIWFIALFGLALAGALPATAQQLTTPAAADVKSLLALNDQDRILGKPDAPVTIVEYASLTCPHCAHFAEEVLPKLKQKWIDTGKAKLVLRDYPLDEPALRAAMVARCAKPDAFYPLVETFFKTQGEWAVTRDYQPELQKWARLRGLNDKEFAACLADKKLEDQVANSRLVASTQLGVDSTPTFFINGQKYDGVPTLEAFDQALTAAAPKS